MDNKPYSRTRVCSIEGCGRKHSSNGYCHKHHEAYIRRGGYKFGEQGKRISRICLVEGCNKIVVSRSYCALHYRRFVNGTPLDLPYYCNKGERNGRWNGGVSEYPNHYLLKKNRLIVLKNYPTCQRCNKKKSTCVSHRNKDKSDHKIENLEALCCSCKSKRCFNLVSKNMEEVKWTK